MRSQLKIRFCDFHRHLPFSQDYFRALLASRYELDEHSAPDFVIYSNYGRSHRQHDCVRIFYSMENERPDFNECDFAITFDYLDSARHLRLPYYLLQPGIDQLAPRPSLSTDELDAQLSQRTDFCAFVHSNPFGTHRNRLFQRLSRYKPLISGGRYRNNLGYKVDNKIDFMRSFKFGFAFENESHPGYTTEKLTDVFLAGAIPIYWGNGCVEEEFNCRSMLNRHDFESDDALIQRIIEIDQDDALWSEYRNQPCFVGNQIAEPFTPGNVLRWLGTIFAAKTQPVATQQKWAACARHVSPPALARRLRRFARHSVKGIRLATGL